MLIVLFLSCCATPPSSQPSCLASERMPLRPWRPSQAATSQIYCYYHDCDYYHYHSYCHYYIIHIVGMRGGAAPLGRDSRLGRSQTDGCSHEGGLAAAQSGDAASKNFTAQPQRLTAARPLIEVRAHNGMAAILATNWILFSRHRSTASTRS